MILDRENFVNIAISKALLLKGAYIPHRRNIQRALETSNNLSHFIIVHLICICGLSETLSDFSQASFLFNKLSYFQVAFNWPFLGFPHMVFKDLAGPRQHAMLETILSDFDTSSSLMFICFTIFLSTNQEPRNKIDYSSYR